MKILFYDSIREPKPGLSTTRQMLKPLYHRAGLCEDKTIKLANKCGDNH